MTKNRNTTWMVTGVLGVAGVVAAVLATSTSGASPAPGEVIVVTPGPQVTVEQTDDGAGRPAEDATTGGGRDGGSSTGDERTSGGSGSGSSTGGGDSDDDDAPQTVSMASPVSADSAPSAQSADD